MWYETRCWRYERPQAGRYREFTQIGVEILNLRAYDVNGLVKTAEAMVREAVKTYEVLGKVKRGLAYYVEDGFEVICPILGAQKQVAGGGRYAEGIGFAVGLDRLVLANQLERTEGS